MATMSSPSCAVLNENMFVDVESRVGLTDNEREYERVRFSSFAL